MINHRSIPAALLLVALSSAGGSAQGQDGALRLATACAPRAGVGDGPAGVLRIIGSQDTVPRSLYGARDLLIVGGGTSSGVRLGQQFFIRRSMNTTYRPAGEHHAVDTIGWIRIAAVNQTTAIALVDGVCDGILIGDYLEPYVEPVVPPAAERADTTGELDFSAPGHVLFGVDNHSTGGVGKFMVADIGTARSAAPGSRYAVYRDIGLPGVPLAYVGEAVVVATDVDTSTVRLTLTRDVVNGGDLLIPRMP